MRHIREFYPAVFLLGAMLIIVMGLVMLYMLQRISADDAGAVLPEPVKVGVEAAPDSMGWKPLFNSQTLDGWEITNFGPQGPVAVHDSSIILYFGDGATGVTWDREFPVSDYEISLEAMRVSGNDFFCGLTFPVGDEHCTFIVGGWGGSLVGLSSIDGSDASSNITSTRMRFENGRWYEIRVKVTGDSISCFIDDEIMANVPVEPHTFSIRSEVGLSRPLGIASWYTTSALRNIKFRNVN